MARTRPHEVYASHHLNPVDNRTGTQDRDSDVISFRIHASWIPPPSCR